jgi:hypothetical protein
VYFAAQEQTRINRMHAFSRPWTAVKCGTAADLTLNLCQEEMSLLICLLEQTSIENATLQLPDAQPVREMLSHLEAKLYALLATSGQAGSRPVPRLPGQLRIVHTA